MSISVSLKTPEVSIQRLPSGQHAVTIEKEEPSGGSSKLAFVLEQLTPQEQSRFARDWIQKIHIDQTGMDRDLAEIFEKMCQLSEVQADLFERQDRVLGEQNQILRDQRALFLGQQQLAADQREVYNSQQALLHRLDQFIGAQPAALEEPRPPEKSENRVVRFFQAAKDHVWDFGGCVYGFFRESVTG